MTKFPTKNKQSRLNSNNFVGSELEENHQFDPPTEFKFTCPYCNQRLQSEADNAGRSILCPECQNELIIPQAPAVELSLRHTSPQILNSASLRPFNYPTRPSECKRTSSLALTSFCFSLASFFIGPLGFIPGIITGHMAKRYMYHNSKLKGRGFANAGIFIGYFSLIISVGLMIGLGLLRNFVNQKVAETETNYEHISNELIYEENFNQNQGKTRSARSTGITDKAKPAKPLWRKSLDGAPYPQGKAAGKIHNRDFVYERAILENGILTLRQGQDFFADNEIVIFLSSNTSELDGKKYDINEKSSFHSSISIHMSWTPKKDELPETEIFLDNFALKLEFDKSSGNTLPGRIYLCFNDPEKSVVAGSFIAQL